MPIPLPVIANTFRMVLKYNCSGQTAVNVFHIQANTSGQHATDALAAVVGAWPASNMLCHTVTACTIGEIDCTPLDGVSATQSQTVSGSKWTGVQTGDAIIAVATMLKLQTAKRGPKYRGRVFLPFTSETAQTNGFLDPTLTTNLTNAWVGFQTALVAFSPEWSLGVASYDRKNSGAGAEFTGIVALSAERALGTQRRRQTRIR